MCSFKDTFLQCICSQFFTELLSRLALCLLFSPHWRSPFLHENYLVYYRLLLEYLIKLLSLKRLHLRYLTKLFSFNRLHLGCLTKLLPLTKVTLRISHSDLFFFISSDTLLSLFLRSHVSIALFLCKLYYLSVSLRKHSITGRYSLKKNTHVT